jgi:small GTP-binding protein
MMKSLLAICFALVHSATNFTPPNSDNIKTVFLGEAGCGKTSIGYRFAHLRPLPPGTTQPTIGAAFSRCRISDPATGRSLELGVFDTAGQERFNCLVPMYCRGAKVAFFVYDITDQDSFTRLQQRIIPETMGRMERDVLCILVGNKLDLVQANPEARQVTTLEGEAMVMGEDERLVAFFEVSAIGGDEFAVMRERVVQMILDAHEHGKNQSPMERRLVLGGGQDLTSGHTCWSC